MTHHDLPDRPRHSHLARRGVVALAALLVAVVVGAVGLLTGPTASATTLLHASDAVAPIPAPVGQRVGPHEPVLPGQGRPRAPGYDQMAVGSCVGAEAETSTGSSVFRTPRLGDGPSELNNGLNPANHLEGDQSAYVGTENVARDFADPKVGGYENGYVRYDMHLDFEQEFSQYKFPYTTANGEAGFEWQIPASQIGRFNDLTLGRTWVSW